MMYRLSLGTTNLEDAEVFEEFKDAAKKEGISQVAFLAVLMRSYNEKASDGSSVELMRIANALEEIASKIPN